MSTDQQQTNHQATRTKAELEAEIAQLRHSVGDSVEALTYRLDVKSRAKNRIREIPPAVPVGAATALALGLGLWLWRRRSHGR